MFQAWNVSTEYNVLGGRQMRWPAPAARLRRCLFGAASAEGLSSIYGFFHWFAPLLVR
jgi:hypothetical protein